MKKGGASKTRQCKSLRSLQLFHDTAGIPAVLPPSRHCLLKWEKPGCPREIATPVPWATVPLPPWRFPPRIMGHLSWTRAAASSLIFCGSGAGCGTCPRRRGAATGSSLVILQTGLHPVLIELGWWFVQNQLESHHRLPTNWTKRLAPRPCFQKPWHALHVQPPRVTPASLTFNSHGLMLLRMRPQSECPQNAWTYLLPKWSFLHFRLQIELTLARERAQDTSRCQRLPEQPDSPQLPALLAWSRRSPPTHTQVLVEGLRVIMRDQGHPPQLTIAAPCHLHVDHTVGAQGGGQLVARFPKASSGSVIRSSHTARNLICSFVSWIPCSGRSGTVAGVRARKTEAAIKMPISLYRSFTSACVCGYRRPTLERNDLISAVLALWAAISEDFFCLMPSPVPLRSGLTNRGISRSDLVDLLERPRMPKDSDHWWKVPGLHLPRVVGLVSAIGYPERRRSPGSSAGQGAVLPQSGRALPSPCRWSARGQSPPMDWCAVPRQAIPTRLPLSPRMVDPVLLAAAPRCLPMLGLLPCGRTKSSQAQQTCALRCLQVGDELGVLQEKTQSLQRMYTSPTW